MIKNFLAVIFSSIISAFFAFLQAINKLTRSYIKPYLKLELKSQSAPDYNYNDYVAHLSY